MKFQYKRTSDCWQKEPNVIELATLEELLAWIKKQPVPVIITEPNPPYDPLWQLEIYDDYRE